MRFSVQQNDLARELNLALRAIPNNSEKPVLANFFFRVESDQLFVKAFDLSVGVSTVVNVIDAVDGEWLLPAKQLAELVAKLPDVILDFEWENDQFIISTGTGKFKIPTLPTESYFQPPIVEAPSFHLPCAEFAKGIAAVAPFCAAEGEGKGIMEGIHFEVLGRELGFMSTNRVRFALISFDLDVDLPPIFATIPKKSMELVRALIGDSKGTISVQIEREQVKFSLLGREVVCRALNGEFPAIRQLVERVKTPIEVVTEKKRLIESIQRVALFLPSNIPTISVRVERDRLEIGDDGMASDSLDCSATGGLVFHCNHKYLLECTKGVEGDKVKLGLSAWNAPFLVVNPDTPRLRAGMVPIKKPGFKYG